MTSESRNQFLRKVFFIILHNKICYSDEKKSNFVNLKSIIYIIIILIIDIISKIIMIIKMLSEYSIFNSKLLESVQNVYLLLGGKRAWERTHNGAVKREGVKILKNESHQSEEDKKSWIQGIMRIFEICRKFFYFG